MKCGITLTAQRPGNRTVYAWDTLLPRLVLARGARRDTLGFVHGIWTATSWGIPAVLSWGARRYPAGFASGLGLETSCRIPGGLAWGAQVLPTGFLW